MNYLYLLKRTAEKYYTAARRFDDNKKLSYQYKVSDELKDEQYTDFLLSSDLIRYYKDDMPILVRINHCIIYGWVPYDDGAFLLGPTRFNTSFDMKYEFSSEDLPEISDINLIIPEYRGLMFIEDILLLANSYRSGDRHQPFFDENTICQANWPTSKQTDSMPILFRKIFDNIEEGFVHNPYNHEKRQVESITRGDVDQLEDILKERFPGRYGSLSEDPVRQEIYIGIVETTLASRAAIKGGLHPETAFYLSDITIQKLDKCHDTISAMNISLDMQRKYAMLVAEQKANNLSSENQSSNINISRCKDYVFSHLHDKITVREIANAIGLDENYLSSLFKNVEGVSLKDYIQNEKITLAKHMLTYSNYSYSEISTYLGFSSQSHFGKVFKHFTGYTPKSYRDNFAADDFINDTTLSFD